MISIFMPIWKEQKVSPLIKEHRTIIIPFQKLVWQDIPCVEIAQVVGTILELPIIVSHPNCFLSTRGVALTTIILVMRRCAIPAAAFRNREWLWNLQSIFIGVSHRSHHFFAFRQSIIASDNTMRTDSNKKTVSFGTITIMEFPMVIGDNPSCSGGAPVQIGWQPQDTATRGLEMYDFLRERERVTRRKKLILPVDKRAKILLVAGFSLEEIVMAAEQAARVKKGRYESLKSQGFGERVTVLLETSGKVPKGIMKGVMNTTGDIVTGVVSTTGGLLVSGTGALVNGTGALVHGTSGLLITTGGALVNGTGALVTGTGGLLASTGDALFHGTGTLVHGTGGLIVSTGGVLVQGTGALVSGTGGLLATTGRTVKNIVIPRPRSLTPPKHPSVVTQS